MIDERETDTIAEGVAAAVRLQLLDVEERRLVTSIAAVRLVDLGELPVADRAFGPRDDEGADAASDVVEREVGFGMLEELEAELREVAAARRRVVAGTYGACEACGGPVTPERLEALPATRWCLGCAEHREQLRRGQPDLTASHRR